MNKVIAINKPVGITSMDVIRIIRKKLNIQKVGHAGTLDPLASGVLIVCTGKETKNIHKYMDLEKEYEGLIDLSAFSETDDSEGPLEPISAEKKPTLEEVTNALDDFIGEIDQIPPKYSAIKINGKAAYKRARQGEVVTIKSRTVKINDIKLLNYSWPLVKINVVCQKGTYIRSLARDIGVKLKTGGYLKNLIRTRIGNFDIKSSENI